MDTFLNNKKVEKKKKPLNINKYLIWIKKKYFLKLIAQSKF